MRSLDDRHRFDDGGELCIQCLMPGRKLVRRQEPERHARASARLGHQLRDVFDYIEMLYDPKRRHSHAGSLSPVEYEKQ